MPQKNELEPQDLPALTNTGNGAQSKYDSAMDEQAFKLALLGLTNEQIADFFGIVKDTFYRWRKIYPSFEERLQAGRLGADANVAHGLYRRATGVVVKSERAMKGKSGEVVIAQTLTEIPPDTAAAKHWLGLRQRETWAPPEEGAADDLPGPSGEPAIDNLSDAELQAKITEYQMRRNMENGQ